jgi:hypothetical protein
VEHLKHTSQASLCILPWTTNEYHFMMGSQKVPGMEIMHCNGRAYGNAYQSPSK